MTISPFFVLLSILYHRKGKISTLNSFLILSFLVGAALPQRSTRRLRNRAAAAAAAVTDAAADGAEAEKTAAHEAKETVKEVVADDKKDAE